MGGVHVGPVTIDIAAPPQLVYQMLAAIGQGGQPNGERAEILAANSSATSGRASPCPEAGAGSCARASV